MMRRRMGRPGLLGTMARTAVVAGTATAVSGNVQRRQAGRQEAAEAQQAPVYQQAPPPAAEPQDKFAQLAELGKLHQAGVLTEEEFASEKAKVLNS